ncbi:MAG TPA: hypothetical protein PLA01_09490 [Acetivibrio sp.]|nr:hypothetical protein [Acetivibrio sp.]
MIELIDNSVQLAVLTVCCIYSAIRSIRRNDHVWFLLTCFYGAYALGLVYWLLFIVFHSKTPSISPVSDLSWMASVLFILVMQNTLRLPGESTYRPILAWTAPVFSTVMCFFFFHWGDYFLNVLWAALMGACGYQALRGLLWARRQSNGMNSSLYFHITVLTFLLVEYSLWLASCFWKTESLLNPYYWFDFLMSATFFTFLPSVKKVVTE